VKLRHVDSGEQHASHLDAKRDVLVVRQRLGRKHEEAGCRFCPTNMHGEVDITGGRESGNIYFWNLCFNSPEYTQYHPRAYFGYLTMDL
jgi:hypothetical protein